MCNESGYSEQKNLSAIQLLAEVPTLIETLLSAIFSGALLLYVDLVFTWICYSLCSGHYSF